MDVGMRAQFPEQFALAPGREFPPGLGQMEGEEHEGHQLRGEGLGGGHADLRAGVGVDQVVRLPHQAAAEDIADGQHRTSLLFGHADGCEGVGRLPGLRHGGDQGGVVDFGVSVTELAAQVGFHRDGGVAFDEQAPVHGGIVGGAATHDAHAFQVADAFGIEGEVGKRDPVAGEVVVREPAQHPGLLVDFFEHEGFKAGGIDGGFLQLHFVPNGGDGSAVEILDFHAVGGEAGDFAVFEVDHLVHLGKDGGHVAGDKHALRPATDHEGGAEPGGVEGIWLVAMQQADGVGAAGLAQGGAEGGGEIGGLRLVRHQVGQDLGVGFGCEGDALVGEGGFEVLIIFDDAVVHHGQAAGACGVGMAVALRGLPVGGPAGMADARPAAQGLADEFALQRRQPTDGPAGL